MLVYDWLDAILGLRDGEVGEDGAGSWPGQSEEKTFEIAELSLFQMPEKSGFLEIISELYFFYITT